MRSVLSASVEEISSFKEAQAKMEGVREGLQTAGLSTPLSLQDSATQVSQALSEAILNPKWDHTAVIPQPSIADEVRWGLK